LKASDVPELEELQKRLSSAIEASIEAGRESEKAIKAVEASPWIGDTEEDSIEEEIRIEQKPNPNPNPNPN